MCYIILHIPSNVVMAMLIDKAEAEKTFKLIYPTDHELRLVDISDNLLGNRYTTITNP